MKKVMFAIVMFLTTNVFAMGEDDPLLFMVKIDKLEARKSGDFNPIMANGEAWLGKDLNKLWFKAEAEYIDSAFEELEAQLLYSRAISAFWDLQVGWRRDLRPIPEKDWLAISLNGLAPYMFESDFSLFVDNTGLVNLRLDTELELMLTQQLILSPEVALNVLSDSTDSKQSGLSDLSIGLRVYYEIVREFAPYIGITQRFSYNDKHVHTGAGLHDEGNGDLQFILGLRLWY